LPAPTDSWLCTFTFAKGDTLKKLAFLGGAGALGVLVVLCAPGVRAADHLDSANVSMPNNAMADINDVYAWNTSDAAKVNLALTVSPNAGSTATFGPAVQYVLHVTQHAAFGDAGTESKVICTFTNNMAGQCWVVDKDGETVDYVSGDFSAIAGKASTSGKVRVFAGRRSDPFFFNLGGFLNAKQRVNDAVIATTFNGNGCPELTAASTLPADLRTDLSTAPGSAVGPCAAGALDCFATFNTMAIVVQVDKELLVQAPNTNISVWASTHATP
jgi:Domain of unknown function (DUF4331)